MQIRTQQHKTKNVQILSSYQNRKFPNPFVWRLLQAVLCCSLIAGCKTVSSQTGNRYGQVVSSVQELYVAVAKAKPGESVLLSDGVYKDVQLSLTNSGTPEKPVQIIAKNPGKVFFTGDPKLELRGEHLILNGIYFKDGNRDPAKWKSHGPGLIAIYGSYNRITNCAFDAFDEANSAWITTSLTADGKVPQYCRIDHCSFVNKLTFDQVINLNNAPKQNADSTAGGPAMYHRVDHNFFSNPPKPGNAGGAIRIGYYRYDTGRCQVDSNLFMRQDSEAEIITSKSRENVYYANTFVNCQGTLNFRHGDHQVAINNFFIGTDAAFDYGGMFVWGSAHVIGANYFNLPRTLKSRGKADVYLNPGAPGTEHALAFDILLVNNAFVNNNGYAVHFNPLDKQRKELSVKNGWTFETPHDIHFVSNLFYGNDQCEYPFFHNDYPGNHGITWQNDVARGCLLCIVEESGMMQSSCQLEKEGGIYQPVSCKDYHYAKVTNIEPLKGIALNFNHLISRGIVGTPLSYADVGTTWAVAQPIYAQSGVLPTPLKEKQDRVIEQSGRLKR